MSSLTDAGAEALASAIIGDGGIDLFDANNAAVGVGNKGNAFAVAQTELEAEEDSAGDGEALRKGMASGWPKRDPDADGSDNKIQFRAEFDLDEANFAWNEWGVFNTTTAGGGYMLCRVVESFGTKTNADTWIFEVDVSIGAS